MTGSPSIILSKSLLKTKHALQVWNKNHFGHIQTRISLLTSQLDEVQQLPSTIQLHHLETTMKVELNDLLLQEDLLWKTKSRETWLTCKDLNTKFFMLPLLLGEGVTPLIFCKLPRVLGFLTGILLVVVSPLILKFVLLIFSDN
ncbi:hypothetical protein SLA2020_435050 [Shorea laevis]